MKTYTAKQFRAWGAIGGRKSRRTLTSVEAKAMSVKGVAAKAEKRAKEKQSQ